MPQLLDRGDHRRIRRPGAVPGRPRRLVAAATSLPARHHGLPGRGRIAPGLPASLVLVDGDPLQDIAATRSIVDVWRHGVRQTRPTGER
ncbi:amidohydrolase family protein [Nonomuraea terrae]|uniref:amidohydrolase family protein n=1 Tax=Nonomuraea terrae TaxID=2530383 RepID=UPI0037939391